MLRPQRKSYQIYFFFPFYHTGGAEKVHAQIANATGDSNCIIYFTRKSVNKTFLGLFNKSGCTIKDISLFTDNKWLYFFNLIYRGVISGYINRQKTKPIVFNGQCNFAYKISPWVNSGIRQVELIHSFNSFSYIRTPFLPFIEKTVMISRARINQHLQFYEQVNIPEEYGKKIVHINNAGSIPGQRPVKPVSPFTVLFVGRGGPEKRVHIFTAIADAIHALDSSVQFEILGDVDAVTDQKEFPFIQFYGNISDESEVGEIYSKAHLLLLTSSTEGFPLVVIEAMAHGCTVGATPVGDIPFHVNGERGILFSSAENENKIIEEAKSYILKLRDDASLLQRISATNFHYAQHTFAIEKFNNAWQQLLNN